MYLLGIDNGGSDIKCAVYDLNGKELAISRTQIPIDIPEAGLQSVMWKMYGKQMLK